MIFLENRFWSSFHGDLHLEEARELPQQGFRNMNDREGSWDLRIPVVGVGWGGAGSIFTSPPMLGRVPADCPHLINTGYRRLDYK